MNRLLFGLTLHILFAGFSNCYYNPIVQNILNPKVSEEANPFLALLGLGGSNLIITGQIRDANGVAQVGLVLLPPGSSPNLKSFSPPYTTDAGGRFYIPFQTGRISYDVFKNGTIFFTLVLNVLDQNSITPELVNAPSGLEVSSLLSYSPEEVPSFFELVRVYIIQGDDPPVEINLHNSNANNVNYIYLEFSESPAPIPEEEGAVENWIASNISIEPPINLEAINSESTLDKTRSLGYAFPFGMDTLYTIRFGSGIKSASGKSLTERKVTFCMEPNVNCGF